MRKPLTLEVLKLLEGKFCLILDTDNNVKDSVQIEKYSIEQIGFEQGYLFQQYIDTFKDSKYILAIKDIDLSPYK